MNSTYIFDPNFFQMWDPSNWSKFKNWTPLKIIIVGFFLVGVAFFPMQVMEQAIRRAPQSVTTPVLDTKTWDELMMHLQIAQPICVNPVPLRCEGPVKGA